MKNGVPNVKRLTLKKMISILFNIFLRGFGCCLFVVVVVVVAFFDTKIYHTEKQNVKTKLITTVRIYRLKTIKSEYERLFNVHEKKE